MSLRVHAFDNGVGLLGLFVALACSAVVFTASPARAAAELKIHDFAAGAVAAYNVCTLQPNGDSLCEDFIVQYVRSRSTGDRVSLEHFKALFHSDGTVTELVPEVGFTHVSGSYDRSRLTFARTSGATLDLYDIDPATGVLTANGRTATLGPFEWTAASAMYVFGNDGPFGFGLPVGGPGHGPSGRTARTRSCSAPAGCRW